MALTDAQAKALLETLLGRKGTLKIITSEVKPTLRVDTKDERAPAKEGVDLRDPASMVLHDVVKIEPHPVRKTHLVASSAEGDAVESYDGPQALLVRLLEYKYFDPNNAASTKKTVESVVEAMHEAASVRAV